MYGLTIAEGVVAIRRALDSRTPAHQSSLFFQKLKKIEKKKYGVSQSGLLGELDRKLFRVQSLVDIVTQVQILSSAFSTLSFSTNGVLEVGVAE